MNADAIFAIIRTALAIAEDITSGTHVQGDVNTIASLEDLMSQVYEFHKSEAGAPMDLSKFQQQAPSS